MSAPRSCNMMSSSLSDSWLFYCGGGAAAKKWRRSRQMETTILLERRYFSSHSTSTSLPTHKSDRLLFSCPPSAEELSDGNSLKIGGTHQPMAQSQVG
jgi:hypothetical protein